MTKMPALCSLSAVADDSLPKHYRTLKALIRRIAGVADCVRAGCPSGATRAVGPSTASPTTAGRSTKEA